MREIPYIHFTEDQKRRASEVDLEQFLLRRGEKLLPYLRLGIELGCANEVTLTVKSNGERDLTAFTYNVQEGVISGRNPNKTKEAKGLVVSGPLDVKDGKLTMEVYVDRSLVEGFFNDSKSISIRSYANFDSQSVSLEADGDIAVTELYVAAMKSIY